MNEDYIRENYFNKPNRMETSQATSFGDGISLDEITTSSLSLPIGTKASYRTWVFKPLELRSSRNNEIFAILKNTKLTLVKPDSGKLFMTVVFDIEPKKWQTDYLSPLDNPKLSFEILNSAGGLLLEFKDLYRGPRPKDFELKILCANDETHRSYTRYVDEDRSIFDKAVRATRYISQGLWYRC